MVRRLRPPIRKGQIYTGVEPRTWTTRHNNQRCTEKLYDYFVIIDATNDTSTVMCANITYSKYLAEETNELIGIRCYISTSVLASKSSFYSHCYHPIRLLEPERNAEDQVIIDNVKNLIKREILGEDVDVDL